MIPPMNPHRQSVELVARTGRLRQRLEYTGNIGDWTLDSTTRYIYDGWRVIQERDGSNVPTVSYTRGTDLSGSLEGAGGIGGLLARSHGYSSGNWTTHNCYHADGNGNITYLVNSSQTVAASYRYDPFGNTLSSSGSLAGANVYRFSSKEFHATSSLYYYGYRFYDASVQRWLNRDPIGDLGFRLLALKKGMAGLDELNLFAFVMNKSLNEIDPLGLEGLAGSVGVICCGGSPAGARTAMEAGLNAADAAYPDRNSVENRAMRHCVASGMLAVSDGCGPAECIGTKREDFQNNHGGQPPREGTRGKNNNRVGRACAGCGGANAENNPTKSGRGRNLSVRPARTLDQIVACCQDAVDNGRADTRE